jgi:hypothetical protein
MSAFVDKTGRLAAVSAAAPARLELGCGPRKVRPEAIGVDMLDTPAVDVVGDVFEVLRALPDGSVGEVYSAHFLEHVRDLEGLFTEFGRVVRDGGAVEAIVPHFSNPYFYSDPTHTRTFGLYTFAYLAECALFHRAVPRYGRDYGFTFERVELAFLSPFPVRGALRSLWQRAVNSHRWCQEFYEENLTGLVGCYELRATLRRRPRGAP